MPEDNSFAFQQEIDPRRLPPPVVRDEPQTPAQATARDISAPRDTSAPAIPATRDDDLPSWRTHGVQRFGLLLRDFAAGAEGRELPSDRLRARRRQQDELELRALGTTAQAIEQGIALESRLPEAQRPEFRSLWGARHSRFIPGFDRMYGMIASQSDATALAEAFGDLSENPGVARMLRSLPQETVLSMARDPTIMANLRAGEDARNLPVIAARRAEVRAIAEAAERHGMAPRGTAVRVGPVDVLDQLTDATHGREANGRDNAVSDTSTAAGRGQFVERTWAGPPNRPAAGLAIAHARELGIDPELAQRAASGDPQARQSILALRTNRDIARRATRLYHQQNMQALERAGLPTDPGTLQVAYQFGADGAAQLLRARPDQPVNEVVSAEAYQANRSQLTRNGQPRTVSEVIGEIRSDIMRRMEGTVPAGRGISMTDLRALNIFNRSEMGTIGRHPDVALAMGVVPPALQMREAQARSDQATAAPQHFMVDNQDGTREVMFVNPSTRQVIGRIPAGVGSQGGVMEGLLRRNPQTWNEQERAYFQAQISRGNMRATFDPTTGAFTLEQGTAAGGMTATQQGQQAQRLQETQIAAETLTTHIARMREQLPTTQTGITAWMTNNIEALGDQIDQTLSDANLSVQVPAAIRNHQYNLSGFAAQAGNNVRFRSNVIRLGYMIARAEEPSGRSLTNADVQNALDRFGASGMLTSRNQIMQSLDEVERSVLADWRTRFRAVHGPNAELPPALRDRAAPDAPQAPGGSAQRAPQITVGTIIENDRGERRRWNGTEWESVAR